MKPEDFTPLAYRADRDFRTREVVAPAHLPLRSFVSGLVATVLLAAFVLGLIWVTP